MHIGLTHEPIPASCELGLLAAAVVMPLEGNSAAGDPYMDDTREGALSFALAEKDLASRLSRGGQRGSTASTGCLSSTRRVAGSISRAAASIGRLHEDS